MVLFGSNMHRIVCWLGFAPDLTEGAYSAPKDSLAGLVEGWN